PPQEGTQTRLFVESFKGTDSEAAQELFVNRLAATQKFVFVADASLAELIVGGTVGQNDARYAVNLIARGRDGSRRPVLPASGETLEEAAEAAAQIIAALHKRSGYVIKHEG